MSSNHQQSQSVWEAEWLLNDEYALMNAYDVTSSSSNSTVTATTATATTAKTLGKRKNLNPPVEMDHHLHQAGGHGHHNAIERKYRNTLNHQLTVLKLAVPALKHAKLLDSKERAAIKRLKTKKSSNHVITHIHHSDNDDDSDDPNSHLLPKVDGVTVATKLNKATILKKAADYIAFLQKERQRLLVEIDMLKSSGNGGGSGGAGAGNNSSTSSLSIPSPSSHFGSSNDSPPPFNTSTSPSSSSSPTTASPPPLHHPLPPPASSSSTSAIWASNESTIDPSTFFFDGDLIYHAQAADPTTTSSSSAMPLVDSMFPTATPTAIATNNNSINYPLHHLIDWSLVNTTSSAIVPTASYPEMIQTTSFFSPPTPQDPSTTSPTADSSLSNSSSSPPPNTFQQQQQQLYHHHPTTTAPTSFRLMMAGMLTSVGLVVFALVSQWQKQMASSSSSTSSSRILELDDQDDDNLPHHHEEYYGFENSPSGGVILALALLKYTLVAFIVLRVLRSSLMLLKKKWVEMKSSLKESTTTTTTTTPTSTIRFRLLCLLFDWTNTYHLGSTTGSSNSSSVFNLIKTLMLMTWLACFYAPSTISTSSASPRHVLLLVQSSYLVIAMRLFMSSTTTLARSTRCDVVLKKMASWYLESSFAFISCPSNSSSAFDEGKRIKKKQEEIEDHDPIVKEDRTHPLFPFIKTYFHLGGWVNQISIAGYDTTATTHQSVVPLQLVSQFCSLWKAARLEKLLLLDESVNLFLPTRSSSSLSGNHSQQPVCLSSNGVVASIMSVVADNDGFEWCVETENATTAAAAAAAAATAPLTSPSSLFDRLRWYVQAYKLLSLLTTANTHTSATLIKSLPSANTNTTPTPPLVHAHSLAFWRSCIVGLNDALARHEHKIRSSSCGNGRGEQVSLMLPSTEIHWMRVVMKCLNILVLSIHVQTGHPLASSSVCATRLRLRAVKSLAESLLVSPATTTTTTSSSSSVWASISTLMALYAASAAIHSTTTKSSSSSSMMSSASARLYLGIRKSIVPLIETRLLVLNGGHVGDEGEAFVRRMADGVSGLGRRILV